MSRRKKKPPAKPSRAYLVSFGGTMTSLLAFFIVLNTLAKDQTGADLYTGTGSFVNAFRSKNGTGTRWGDKSDQAISRLAASPVYAIPSNEKQSGDLTNAGPDPEGNAKKVRDRQAEDFQRFLTAVEYQYHLSEEPPIKAQVVFDSFENLGKGNEPILGTNALQIAADAIGQLSTEDFQLEIVVWATMPSQQALQRAMDLALEIEAQIDQQFNFFGDQRARLCVTARPWLFVDAKRPRMSFVLSRIGVQP